MLKKYVYLLIKEFTSPSAQIIRQIYDFNVLVPSSWFYTAITIIRTSIYNKLFLCEFFFNVDVLKRSY